MDIESLTSEIGFTDEELRVLLSNLDHLTADEVAEVNKMVDELKARDDRHGRQNDLIAFCVHMMPEYLVGRHHRRLANLLMDIEDGRKDRICVSVPPRHGKSQMASIFYAAWYLGKNPGHQVMLVSHTTDLAVDFGRKVRNIIASPDFQEVFPGVELSADSKSAGRWGTNFGGSFFACGIGSALAGRGADMLIVDDPHSEQLILNGNFEVFAKAYEWFAFGARTRLMPGGKIAIIHCMVGDTRVLMADGTETELKDVKPGDMVASYDGGELVNREVLNWINHGEDEVFNVVLNDGNVVSGNARHPFLVVEGSTEKWVKIRNLEPGMAIRAFVPVATERGIPDSCACTTTTGRDVVSTGSRSLLAPVDGVSGEAWSAAKMRVASPPAHEGYAYSTTTSKYTTSSGQRAPTTTANKTATHTCGIGTVSAPRSTETGLAPRVTDALFVGSTPLQPSDPGRGTQTARSPLTTAMTPGGYEDCSVTDVTCSCETTATPTRTETRLCTLRTVTEIVPNGREDVFDIEVEGTHNFVASGNVVSNTRWHLDDLIGKVTRDMVKNPEADQYEVFEFPAILETDVVTPEGTTETKESPLWPEFFDLTALHRTKASMPLFQWSAQYQQNPTSEEAAIVKRDWWRVWKGKEPPQCEFIISSLDSAAEKHNRADYTSLTTWGVFFNDETSQHELILLNAVKERFEFPELKAMCLEHYTTWEPDAFIVEKKSSGTAIYQELRRMGIAVSEYTPHRGSGDKYARLNAVADMISSGLVWVPETRWADDLVDEMASFPYGSFDDQVDSSTMALSRFRQGGFIRLATDVKDDPPTYQGQREYY